MELPEAFLHRMQRLLGDEYAAFLASYSQQPALGLRVNTLKLSRQDFISLFPSPLVPVPWCKSGFILPARSSYGKHPLHAAGVYYLQDPSTMAAAELLAPCPGEKVLDLAAAPGGKTTHLAALMENKGVLVANEIHPRRVWELAENLERCGVTNAVVLNETPSRLADHFGAYFDRVLVDAPCSGEGMFRKAPTARAEWSVGLVESCAIRQLAILNDAARLTTPGGFLAYTTCTFAPEENEGVVWRFLSQHPDFELIQTNSAPGFFPGRPDWTFFPASMGWTDAPGQARDYRVHLTVRLWPHSGGAEGHFIAIMQRQGDVQAPRREITRRKQLERLPAGLYAAFNAFWQNTLWQAPPVERLSLHGAYLYQLPTPFPELAGLKIIHPGWWLGVMRSKRFEPSHALAMALKAQEARRILSLAEKQAINYLRGESFKEEGDDGWLLVTIRAGEKNFPLGWGRRARGGGEKCLSKRIALARRLGAFAPQALSGASSALAPS